jgi:hypothetical protein
MNRRTIAASVSAAALAATLAACKPAPINTSQNAAASNVPSATAAPACTVEFGPNQAGIYATSHKIDAVAFLACNGHASGVLVSLTLAYAPPGTSIADDQQAASADYTNAQPSYTASTDCRPGSYALHVYWGATVNGAALSDQTWGKTATVTAADCARS